MGNPPANAAMIRRKVPRGTSDTAATSLIKTQVKRVAKLGTTLGNVHRGHSAAPSGTFVLQIGQVSIFYLTTR